MCIKKLKFVTVVGCILLGICLLFGFSKAFANNDESNCDASLSSENKCFVDKTKETSVPVYRIDFKNVDGLDYFPVFNSVPEGTTFYSADGKTTYTSMNPEIAYAIAPVGTEIKAVRDIQNVAYNSVYGTDESLGPKTVLESWAQANLATGESVEKLSQQDLPSDEPKINDIGLTTIWKALNREGSDADFGGRDGRFWSCVTYCENIRWSWYWSSRSVGWWSSYRDDVINLCVCVSRVFYAGIPPTQYKLATDGNADWKEGDTTVESITVVGGEAIPQAGETITYKGVDKQNHTVTATPKQGYQFDSCSYDAGTKTYTASFKFKIDFIRTEKIGKDLKQVRYYPVFDTDHYPEGAEFFDKEGNKYTSMNPNIDYALAPKDTEIKAVRDIQNVAYNSVYDTDISLGPRTVLESWAQANLATGESVEKLSQQDSPSGEPKINDIGLTTIWEALNRESYYAGFGGHSGQFWSCVADFENYAWYWSSFSVDWYSGYRDDVINLCVCVSRVFYAGIPPTQYKLATDGNGDWKEGDTTVESITVAGGETIPNAGETITYKGVDKQNHTVTATPKQGYQFDSCSYDAGTKTYTASFNYKIDFIRTEKIGKDLKQVRYYPVFDTDHYPEGAEFFDKDGNKYTSMNPNIDYALAPKGTKIKAVRDIQNVAYNFVYGTDISSGPKTVLESWAQANLATGESVEKLSQQDLPSGEPKINDIGLTAIWKALNSERRYIGFGGPSGRFWSCVVNDADCAWCWNSRFYHWCDYNRGSDDDNMCVCVSRVFN